MKALISALTGYTMAARRSMSKRVRASILCIVLLQTRHFATGETTVLVEFKWMSDMVAAKQTNIMHAEVPDA
eukprot:6759315-Ditylum_brightwellii.AAC.1